MLVLFFGAWATLWRRKGAKRMRAALQLVGWETPSLEGYRVEVAWCWESWAFGLCTEFAELGFAALVIGPCHIQFEWPY